MSCAKTARTGQSQHGLSRCDANVSGRRRADAAITGSYPRGEGDSASVNLL
jgi:hypothetical protein